MGEGRSKGMHLSDILRYKREMLGMPVGQRGFDDDGMSPADKARLMGGFVFELCIESAFKEWLRHSMQGSEIEVESDGIAMTPDWPDGPDGALWEGKSTEKTRRRWDECLAMLEDELAAGSLFDTTLWAEYWGWLQQLMAYCRRLGNNRGTLAVWWKRGNYKYDDEGRADVRHYPFEFTELELEQNWNDVLSWRQSMLLARKEAQ